MKIQVSNITEESRAINLTVVLEKRGYSVTTKKLKSGWRVVAEKSSQYCAGTVCGLAPMTDTEIEEFIDRMKRPIHLR